MIRLYKVTSKDFTGEMPLVCELKDGGHTQGINSVDISPGKSLLISAGHDSCACVWNLQTKKVVKKLTFRDTEFRDARGNESKDNFLIRGCFFTSCGKYVFLLAAKLRYKSFLVKYSIHATQ